MSKDIFIWQKFFILVAAAWRVSILISGIILPRVSFSKVNKHPSPYIQNSRADKTTHNYTAEVFDHVKVLEFISKYMKSNLRMVP